MTGRDKRKSLSKSLRTDVTRRERMSLRRELQEKIRPTLSFKMERKILRLNLRPLRD